LGFIFAMGNEAAGIGKHVKLNSTGEVVSVVAYDERTIWVTTPDGEPRELLLHEVRRLTPDEESEFLRSRNSL